MDELAQIAHAAFGFRPWAEAPHEERARWMDIARVLAITIEHTPRGRYPFTDAARERLARIAAETYAIKRPSRAWDEKPPESRKRWLDVAAAVADALRQTRDNRLH